MALRAGKFASTSSKSREPVAEPTARHNGPPLELPDGFVIDYGHILIDRVIYHPDLKEMPDGDRLLLVVLAHNMRRGCALIRMSLRYASNLMGEALSTTLQRFKRLRKLGWLRCVPGKGTRPTEWKLNLPPTELEVAIRKAVEAYNANKASADTASVPTYNNTTDPSVPDDQYTTAPEVRPTPNTKRSSVPDDQYTTASVPTGRCTDGPVQTNNSHTHGGSSNRASSPSRASQTIVNGLGAHCALPPAQTEPHFNGAGYVVGRGVVIEQRYLDEFERDFPGLNVKKRLSYLAHVFLNSKAFQYFHGAAHEWFRQRLEEDAKKLLKETKRSGRTSTKRGELDLDAVIRNRSR